MVIHPHYIKRYVHDIRVGQLKYSLPQPLLCVKSMLLRLQYYDYHI